MIILEYLNAQIQQGNTSYAIISSRPRNNNPAFTISRVGGFYLWTFTGLSQGQNEPITGDNRENHFDFYFGMDDLVAQRGLFPTTSARSLGITTRGLRIPTGRVRAGGKAISWSGALARLAAEDISMAIPPLKITKDNEEELILNIDREYSRYTIDNGIGNTRRELHFGVEDNFNVRFNRAVRIPRITLSMTPQQYATVLEAIDIAITIHTRI